MLFVMHIVLLLSADQWKMSNDSSFLPSGNKNQGSLCLFLCMEKAYTQNKSFFHPRIRAVVFKNLPQMPEAAEESNDSLLKLVCCCKRATNHFCCPLLFFSFIFINIFIHNLLSFHHLIIPFNHIISYNNNLTHTQKKRRKEKKAKLFGWPWFNWTVVPHVV